MEFRMRLTKNFIIITIISFLLTCPLISYSPDDFPKSERERIKASGYTELKVYRYNYKSGDLNTGNKVIKQHKKYNNKGLIIAEISYDKKGEVDDKAVYKHNDKGLEIEETSYDKKGKIDGKSVYKYNDKILIIERTYYNTQDEPAWKDVYEWK